MRACVRAQAAVSASGKYGLSPQLRHRREEREEQERPVCVRLVRSDEGELCGKIDGVVIVVWLLWKDDGELHADEDDDDESVQQKASKGPVWSALENASSEPPPKARREMK